MPDESVADYRNHASSKLFVNESAMSRNHTLGQNKFDNRLPVSVSFWAPTRWK
jgi:hypothetical protein